MSDVQLVGLAPGHRDAWAGLWLGYQTFYKVALGPVVEETTWTRLLDAGEPMHGALAVVDGQPVGLVHWIMHRSTWTTADYCYLQDLFVHPDARGHGAGRRLIDHVYGAARAAGCSRVYWLTHETNTDAMALYDQVADRPGFVQYRKIMV